MGAVNRAPMLFAELYHYFDVRDISAVMERIQRVRMVEEWNFGLSRSRSSSFVVNLSSGVGLLVRWQWKRSGNSDAFTTHSLDCKT